MLYCVLKDKNATDGITDIMVRAEDASKIIVFLNVFSLQQLILAVLKMKLKKNKLKIVLFLREKNTLFRQKRRNPVRQSLYQQSKSRQTRVFLLKKDHQCVMNCEKFKRKENLLLNKKFQSQARQKNVNVRNERLNYV